MADDGAGSTTGSDGLAMARDFGARYGDGLGLAVSLGGGGLYFVAWQVAYLHELAERGVVLEGAGRVVGTSAGSIVASVLESGHLSRFATELAVLAKLPKLVGALAPADDLHPSQVRARDVFAVAADAEPDTIRSIGHAALAAQTPSPTQMTRNLGVVLASRRWPSAALHLTCVDTYTGERCVVTRAAKVPVARVCAASSAVPGIFPPQPIGDRRCMDGGVSGTGTHLDLLAGAERAVVLSLTDGSDVTGALMTVASGAVEGELANLRSSGTDVFVRTPGTIDILELMDPMKVPKAIEQGRAQAADDADELRAFLAG